MSDTFADLTGIWHSLYRYSSSGRKGEFTSQHYLRLRREGRHLVFESTPEGNESYVIIRLSTDDNVASGSWQEATNPSGYYKGALYYGVVQLVVDKTGKGMRGKWVGFGKDQEVNTGPWELDYVGETIPQLQAT